VGVSAYQDTVAEMLATFRWEGNHTLPVYGWLSVGAQRGGQAPRSFTPTTAVGWPDLVYVHPATGVVAAIEVKTDPPKGGHRKPVKSCGCCPRPDQRQWLWWWHQVPCCASVVFRPGDDALMVAGWLSNPEAMVSGYGWLPGDQHRHPLSRQQIAHLQEAGSLAAHR
jgi:hypothetical protein